MTVKELISELKKVDGDRIVIMSSDVEGNSHSPLSEIWEGVYSPNTKWSGDVGFSKLTPELKTLGYSEDDIIEGEKALILSPIN